MILSPPLTFDPGVLSNLGSSNTSGTACATTYHSTRPKPLEKGRVLESLSLSSFPTHTPLLVNNSASVSKSSPNDSATMAMTPPTEDAQKIRP